MHANYEKLDSPQRQAKAGLPEDGYHLSQKEFDDNIYYTLGTMAAGIVHEIRNPLQSIRSTMQLVELKYQDKIEHLHQYIQPLLEELNAVNEMLTQFLHLARVESKIIDLADLAQICHRAVTLMQPQALLYGVEIRERYSLDLPSLLCDARRIQQILINLLTNAINARKRGGKIVICLSLDISKTKLILRVADDGQGIEEEVLKKIFDPFFTKGCKDGVGIGLTISQQIAKEHGGILSAASKKNVGTVMTLILPLQTQINS